MAPTTDLMSALVIDQATFMLDFDQEYSGVASGETLAKDLGPALWHAKITCSTLTLDQLAAAQAYLELLQGSQGTFYVWSPARQYPIADRGGLILGAATPTLKSINSDAAHVAVQGLPNGYVLSIGDLMQIDHADGSRALHRVAGAATANGSGYTAQFAIVPTITAAFAVSDAVTLIRPAAEMCILPGTVDPSAADLTGTVAFEAIQIPY